MKAPAFFVDATEYLSNEKVMVMSLADEARMFRAINEAAMRGDKAELAKYPFISRFTMNDDEASHRPAIPSPVRRRVLAAGKCALCGSTQKIEVDHILPWSKGGTHEEVNLQCLCKPCNRKKSNKL